MDKLSVLTVLVIVAIATEVTCQRSPRRPGGRRTSPDAIRLGREFRNGDTTQCQSGIVCSQQVQDSPYRTADGSCNNLQNADWGKALIPMKRFLAPKYDDSISTPRGSSTNSLPSARMVSRILHAKDDADQADSVGVTHMVMQWGQFLDHDMTLTPLQSEDNGDGTTTRYICCGDDLTDPPNGQDTVDNLDICFPIAIVDDPHFTTRTCLDFVRSIQVSNADCTASPVEQLNQITAYIDASNVYGSSTEEMEILRNSLNGGLEHLNGLLPEYHDNSVCNSANGHYCFLAGDERVNEQMVLASLHTIWVRTHNKIARTLANINPHWGHNKVFDETRKIVGAMMQKITYYDFLPIVLGEKILDDYHLTSSKEGHRSNVYDENVDASITNVFATAAYRFGHSLVRATLARYSTAYGHTGEDRLRDVFGETSMLQDTPSNVGALLRGMVSEEAKGGDRFLNTELVDHLFEVTDQHSLDLAALNIQRGRDHGLPGYYEWRAFCGLHEPADFTNFKDIDSVTAMELLELYNTPHDIDIFTGGLAEKRVEGGLVGPTFACILGKQFQNLMKGDRFWFEKPGKTGFTIEQLKEIRKVTLARVMCDVTDTTSIQPNVFKMKNTTRNNLADCSDEALIPTMDLNKWKDDNSQPPPPPPPPSG